MEALNHKLTLEMTTLNSQVTVRIKKSDTKNKLVISLSENGKPYKITENMHAAFVGKKPDGKIVFNDCDIVGNKITYTITAQTSVAVGIVACEIRLYDTNDNLLTSPNFTIVVDETVYDADEIEIESENEINVLDSLISEAKALIAEVEASQFYAIYGATTCTEIHQALQNNKAVFCKWGYQVYPLTSHSPHGTYFSGVNSIGATIVILCDWNGAWSWSTVAPETDASVFIAEFDVTPFADIAAAIEDGKAVYCKLTKNDTSMLIPLTHYDGIVAWFCLTLAEQTQITEITLSCYKIFVSSDGWDYDDFGEPVKIEFGGSGAGISNITIKEI